MSSLRVRLSHSLLATYYIFDRSSYPLSLFLFICFLFYVHYTFPFYWHFFISFFIPPFLPPSLISSLTIAYLDMAAVYEEGIPPIQQDGAKALECYERGLACARYQDDPPILYKGRLEGLLWFYVIYNSIILSVFISM